MNNSRAPTKKTTYETDFKVLIKKTYENFGYQDILNENGLIIGKISIPFLNLNKILKIQELDTQEIIFIKIKDKILTKICYLKDSSETLIASIRKKRFLSYPSKIWLKNGSKRKKYCAIGDFKNYKYRIIDNDNEIVGEINTLENSEDRKKVIQDNTINYYSLKLFNSKYKKILIVASTICLNIINNPYFGVTDLTGFERRIARLRPFGPGKNLN